MNIEPLEARIAPAVLVVSPLTATYTDVDGDLVTIKTSLGAFNSSVFTTQTRGAGDQLLLINLSGGGFAGANLTVSVVKVAGGDGLANIGAIDSTGHDLGTVRIPGDLGQIDAGDANTTTAALRALHVRSMGLYGLTTQGVTGSLRSDIAGPLGALAVASDFHEAHLSVVAATVAEGRIGAITIGGSIVGGSAQSSGRIAASGDIGVVTIGRDVVGGTGISSGMIGAGGKVTSISIGGSLLGGPGASSGQLEFFGNVGPVKIAHDVVGLGFSSGRIVSSAGRLDAVTVGGSVFGGDAESATISGLAGIGPVKIAGNLVGGASEAGRIGTDGSITSVSIGGSLLGGSGVLSGSIFSGTNLGPVKIGHDVKGGGGDHSGKVFASGKIASLTVGDSLLGGSGRYHNLVIGTLDHAGQIYSGGALGLVKIGGDVQGSTGILSASILSRGAIAGVSIGGSLLGGAQQDTAVIATLSAAPMGAVTIAHDLVGGAGFQSARISHSGPLAGVTIGGSLLGGTGGTSGIIRADSGAPATALVKIGHDLAGGTGGGSGAISGSRVVTIGGSLVGGTGRLSGSISAFGTDIDAIRIGHDLVGGSIPGGGATLQGSGYIESDRRIGSIFIGGSIISGTDASSVGELLQNASIRADRDIGSLTVLGGLIGNVTPQGDSPVVISAFGPTPVAGARSDVAIGKLSIGGRVEWARVLAGYDRVLNPVNADAQIGSVTVGGDWIASSLVAGVQNPGLLNNATFGDSNDQKIPEAGELAAVVSRIGSIVIAGQVFGTPFALQPDITFGFVAEQIGALKVGARTFTLQPGAGNDAREINARGDGLGFDAVLHEIGKNISSTVTTTTSAKLVNASTVTYQDSDGDRVTVKFSKPLLTTANVTSVFYFDTGLVNDGVLAVQQLRLLDLQPLASNGLGVTFSVVRSGTGDGLVHVGAINSRLFDVGAVSIPGDLGQIDAGDANLATAGLVALNVRTLGRLGLDTQGPQATFLIPNLQSDIAGRLGALAVREDVVDAFIDVNGAIGAVTIGGSLIGGADPDSGAISATGAIGAVKIGDHLQGGSAEDSGKISTNTGSIASVALGGSLLGGGGRESGRIDAGDRLGPVKIGHNIRGGTNAYGGGLGAESSVASVALGGSLLGGVGQFGGGIEAEGAIGPVSIAHNLLGGGEDAGRIVGQDLVSISIGGSLIGGYDRSGGTIASLRALPLVPNADIGSVKIGHNLLGGTAQATGVIRADGQLTSLTIGGSLLGSSGPTSGFIESQTDTVSLRIGENLQGGAGNNSGSALAIGKLHAVTIGGSFLGGAGSQTGELRGLGVGSVKISGNMTGGSGSQSARIISTAGVGAIEIGGSMLGGVGGNSAQIFTNGGSGIGALTIRGSLVGGAGGDSAEVDCIGVLGALTIGGSLVGGSAANYSGNVNGVFGLGPVKIGGSIYGGSIAGTTGSLIGSGFLWAENGRIASVTLGGSIVAGWDTSTGGGLTRNASIRAADDLGAIVVRGSLHGHAANQVTIIARGQATPGAAGDIALASLTVGGSVERTEILMGYDLGLNFTNANAQVGPVKVTGDWVASSLFGAKRIAAIQIAGLVVGTASAGDAFFIQAAQIGAFQSLGFTAPLTPATDAPLALSLTTGDVTLLEV